MRASPVRPWSPRRCARSRPTRSTATCAANPVARHVEDGLKIFRDGGHDPASSPSAAARPSMSARPSPSWRARPACSGTFEDRRLVESADPGGHRGRRRRPPPAPARKSHASVITNEDTRIERRSSSTRKTVPKSSSPILSFRVGLPSHITTAMSPHGRASSIASEAYCAPGFHLIADVAERHGAHREALPRATAADRRRHRGRGRKCSPPLMGAAA